MKTSYKIMMKIAIKDISLKQLLNIQKNLHNLLSDFPFLPERLKIEKRSNLVCNAYDKKNYVALIKTLKQALNHGLILQKVHKVI